MQEPGDDEQAEREEPEPVDEGPAPDAAAELQPQAAAEVVQSR